MTALTKNMSFDAVLRLSAAATDLKLRPQRQAAQPKERRSVAALSVFTGLGIIAAIIFATGYAALLSDTPGVWIHRLMALTVAQSILIAAVAMKLLPIIERSSFSVRIASKNGLPRLTWLEQPVGTQQRAASVPPPLPAPPKPVVGGILAGREFLEYEDGTIEIDTLVGRRRFFSLDAAKEFVGA